MKHGSALITASSPLFIFKLYDEVFVSVLFVPYELIGQFMTCLTAALDAHVLLNTDINSSNEIQLRICVTKIF